MHTARVTATLLLGIVAAGPSFADDAAAAASTDGASVVDPEPALAQPAPAASRWRAAGVLEADGYRMSVSRGALDVGMRFEPRTLALRPNQTRAEPATLTLPALSFELRSISAGPATASNLAERALGTATPALESAVSKVGIEWKPAQSQVFFNGGVGVRLTGDDSVVMRLRKGTLGVYVKRSF
jgi:hypothetical protein